MVVILRIFLKIAIKKNQTTAIFLTYLGIIITFWGEFSSEGNHLVLGTFLVFMSALTYASYLVGSGWLIPKFGVLLFTSYAMMIATFCGCLHYVLIDRTSVFLYPKEVYF